MLSTTPPSRAQIATMSFQPEASEYMSLVISICRGSVAASTTRTSMSPVLRTATMTMATKMMPSPMMPLARRQALARHDRPDLRTQGVAQAHLEARKPEPQIVAVTGEHVVPGGVALRGHAVGLALVFKEGARHRLAQHDLHQDQDDEGEAVGDRKTAVDFAADHDRVEEEVKRQLEIGFEFVGELKEDVERLAGEERLDHFARVAFVQQPGLVAVVARKALHVLAERAEAGALGKNPADRTDDVRGRLRDENHDQIGGQEIVVGDVAAGADDQVGRGGRQSGLDHQQHHHEIERAAEDELGQGQALELLARYGNVSQGCIHRCNTRMAAHRS